MTYKPSELGHNDLLFYFFDLRHPGFLNTHIHTYTHRQTDRQRSTDYVLLAYSAELCLC